LYLQPDFLMMKYLLLFWTIVLVTFSFGQIKTGKLVFSTVYTTSEGSDSSLTAFSFTSNHFRTENLNKKIYSSAIIDKNSEDVLILVDNQVEKIAYRTDLATAKASQPPSVNYESFQKTKDKKTIGGFNCRLIIGTDVFGNKNEFWYTEEIEIGIKSFGIPEEIPGVGLEYTLNSYSESHHFKLLEYIPGTPDPAMFSFVPPQGFVIQGENSNGSEVKKTKEIRYPAGESGLRHFIQSVMRYPMECIKRGESGLVSVEVSVDANGYPTEHNITMNTGEPSALQDEALRIVRLIPLWLPAEDASGKPIASKRIVSVSFKLPSN